MRILIISNLFPPAVLGGYEILCAQVAARLQARGHTVEVLTSDHAVPSPAREAPDSVAVRRTLHLTRPFGLPPVFDPLREWRVHRHNTRIARGALRGFRPDVVFAWSLLRLGSAAVRAALAAGIPVAWALNDANILSLRRPQRPGPAGMLRWWLAPWLLPGSTLAGLPFAHVAVISRQLREDLVRKGLAVANARVIYQGIEVENFPLREDAGSIASPMRLLYSGQLQPYKGVHTLLEGVRLLMQARPAPALRVTIAGDGPEEYKARLRMLAAEAGAPVHFAGRVPHGEMPALYRAHDVFVFPSIWREPFGLTHLEAMASGLPVVSTAHGGQGEFLREGENALTFPAEHSKALAAALRRLADDPALPLRLARAGRETVERDFHVDRYVDGLEDLLRQAREARR